MGRLVFDNLKKVTLYLMPVRHVTVKSQPGIRKLTCPSQGRFIHRIHGSAYERLDGNANSFEFVPAGLLLDHKRRCHVHLFDVRETGG